MTGAPKGVAYEQWQTALEREFFGPHMVGHAVVFYVDETVESALAHGNGLLVELADAVSAELHWDRPPEMFSRLQWRCRRWESGDQSEAPPVLPVLAVSVLAASKMATQGDISSSNYYERLAEVLSVGARERDNLRSHFRPVAVMWELLDAWLKTRGGERGHSTVSGDSHLTRIGYPISQALLREQDRRILTAFFASTGVKPGSQDEFPGQEIIRRLRLWTASHGRGLSRPLLKALHGAGTAPEAADKRRVLAELLERLVEHWDGTLYERGLRARRVSSLRLVLTKRARQLRWAAEAVTGIGSATVRRDGSGAQCYELSDPYGGFYTGLKELDVTAYQLTHGLVLDNEDLYLAWAPQSLVFFTEDEYSGDLISVGTFSPGEPHMLLVANSELDDVRSVLREVADAERVDERKAPLVGWTLIRNVDLKAAITPAALLKGGMPQAAHFMPSTRRGIRFTGGLRIGTELGHHHYLQGGIPDWLLPRDISQGEVTQQVTLSGEDGSYVHDFPLQKVLRPFPARLMPLDDGTYQVSTPDRGKETFTVSSALCEREAVSAGSIAHRCGVSAAADAERVGPEERAIRGAKAPEQLTLPRTLMIPRRVKELLLIGAKGEPVPLDLPDIPDWMSERLPDEAYGYCAEVTIPDGYVWLIQRWQHRTTVRRLDPGGPASKPTPAGDDTEWAETVMSAASAAAGPLWDMYVTAAREVLK
ncbi:hypothetical protein OHA61_24545 [Streptomyces sp. NBC_00885]|uniref:hypothetical protein n=1 Tax=Streptomyces sp. NBC_00885 TaxID=2975857 RepID=UPI00386D66B5|nr:hypothetical protein OHA61_24545 [Streptomyces sp. NBC_00885]